MKDLIGREAVLKLAYWQGCGNIRYGVVDTDDIENLPAVDAVEVVHARWVGLEYDGYADGSPVYYLWECSACGEEVQGEDVPITHPWCHGCGARMDGE